jgi:hypothetical protein
MRAAFSDQSSLLAPINPADVELLAKTASCLPPTLTTTTGTAKRGCSFFFPQVERKSDGKVYALKRVNISKMSKREVIIPTLANPLVLSKSF